MGAGLEEGLLDRRGVNRAVDARKERFVLLDRIEEAVHGTSGIVRWSLALGPVQSIWWEGLGRKKQGESLAERIYSGSFKLVFATELEIQLR